MRLTLDNLPDDTALLHRLVRDMAALVDDRDGEIERLRQIVKELQRMRFGRRSEQLDPDQFALGLEDLEADIAGIDASRTETSASRIQTRPCRKPLPEHLGRENVTLDVPGQACPGCGGPPSRDRRERQRDARLGAGDITRAAHPPPQICLSPVCSTVMQMPAPERVIAGGLATPALLAHVLVSKYADHIPLYRQSRIFARHGMELERSTLAGWVGGACWWLDALHERLGRHIIRLQPSCSPTTRRSRFSIRGADARRQGGCGSMRVTSGAGRDPNRRR